MQVRENGVAPIPFVMAFFAGVVGQQDACAGVEGSKESPAVYDEKLSDCKGRLVLAFVGVEHLQVPVSTCVRDIEIEHLAKEGDGSVAASEPR